MLFELVSERLLGEKGVFKALSEFGVLFIEFGVVLFGDVRG